MNIRSIRTAAFAVLALGAALGPSAAFAQVGYPAQYQADEDHGGPYADAGQQPVPYDRFGHFSCGFNELHTRLERKACGGSHYNY